MDEVEKQKLVLRQILKGIEDYTIDVPDEIKKSLKELDLTPSEEEKKEGLEMLAIAVNKMNAGYREARALADVYDLSFSIDFVKLNYGGTLTYDKFGWNSSNVNNPC